MAFYRSSLIPAVIAKQCCELLFIFLMFMIASLRGDNVCSSLMILERAFLVPAGAKFKPCFD